MFRKKQKVYKVVVQVEKTKLYVSVPTTPAALRLPYRLGAKTVAPGNSLILVFASLEDLLLEYNPARLPTAATILEGEGLAPRYLEYLVSPVEIHRIAEEPKCLTEAWSALLKGPTDAEMKKHRLVYVGQHDTYGVVSFTPLREIDHASFT